MIVCTVSDAARIARVPERTMRRWIAELKLPTSRVTPQYMVPMHLVEPLAERYHAGKRSARVDLTGSLRG